MGEKRRVPRTLLPWRPPARIRDTKEVRLLDLSPVGARLEHLGLLRPGALCVLELPAALGGQALGAHVAWCAVIGRRRGLDGERYLVSQTGLRFGSLTSAQDASLADALQRVTASVLRLDKRAKTA